MADNPFQIFCSLLPGLHSKRGEGALPGNPKAVAEILDELFEVIPYTIELLEGPRLECDPEVVVPFRPKHAK